MLVFSNVGVYRRVYSTGVSKMYSGSYPFLQQRSHTKALCGNVKTTVEVEVIVDTQ